MNGEFLNMKNMRFCVFFLVLGTMLSLSSCSETKYRNRHEKPFGPAATVVNIYCEIDGRGVRTSSNTWYFISALFTWPDEPGWDSETIISKYRIIDEKYKGKKAYVTVEYDVIRRWYSKKKNYIEKEVFTLGLHGQEWKIEKIGDDVIEPHVYPKYETPHTE